MDKKYTLIGILFILAAVGLFYFNATHQPPPAPIPADNPEEAASPGTISPAGAQNANPEATTTNPAQTGAGATISAATPAEAAAASAPATPSGPPPAPWMEGGFAPLEPTHADEQIVSLSNEFIEARLTNYGGAIAAIALKKHRRMPNSDDPLVLNTDHYAPVLAFSTFGGADFATKYEQISAPANEVVYRTVVMGMLEITRRYWIGANDGQQDPYVIQSETAIRNLTNGAVNLPKEFAINLGTGELVHETDSSNYLTVGRFNGKSLSHIPRSALDETSGILGFIGGHAAVPFIIDPKADSPSPADWATVENQFFATIVTPDKPGTGITARRVELPPHEDSLRPRYGLAGEMRLESHAVAPAATETYHFDVYAGPKEYKRLARLGENRDKVMGWGNILGGISKILLIILTAVHSVVGNWGIAIVCTTLALRFALWPLTGIQTRSAKRMAKIQGPLKELQEKYKDNRQKLTEETMKLWKTHKVNPLAGCLPLFVQMPIFIGWFTMLRTAAELRFGSFLWISDLSAPDTLAHIPGLGFPINLMPLLMGATMMVQMRLSPTPTTDNTQAKMMKFMPLMMLAFCYTYSSGLSLYWTTSNLFTIFQQWVTNRSRDVEDATATASGAADRAKPVHDARVTNVRDGKKKKKR